MAIARARDPGQPDKKKERRALGVACAGHALHDGYTDLIWVALPIWQAEFALSYAAVGALRMIYTGTMAGLQIPAVRIAEHLGGGAVLALGTALCGLCYALAGAGYGFWWLVAVLFLGGLGAATQHPIGSALVTRTVTGARALSAFGTYNFSGDVGKVMLPALAAGLLLVMPWRPAYALLGLLGIMAAVPIFLLAPRLLPEEAPSRQRDAQAPQAKARSTRSHLGYRILIAFGVAHSVIRGALFVLLPFLLIGKGAAVGTAGVALTRVFLGGAFGKLACAWVARRLGTVATIVVAQALTATGTLAVLVLPLSFSLALLPVLGIALNGVTTVTYGSVPSHASPDVPTASSVSGRKKRNEQGVQTVPRCPHQKGQVPRRMADSFGTRCLALRAQGVWWDWGVSCQVSVSPQCLIARAGSACGGVQPRRRRLCAELALTGLRGRWLRRQVRRRPGVRLLHRTEGARVLMHKRRR
jgi:MFS family permease